MERSHAQAVMDDLHDALGRRLAVSSLAPCPVEFTAALVNLCSTQSCGKCTPCRVGLSALSDLLADVLEGRADESTLNLIERTARTIYLSSDCAIGYEAGAMALTAIRGFRDDFEHHIREHSCGFDREARVPCVSGCPAHVDIPGYISLVEAGRYADAVKVIRKNNPLPLVCGLVCEHPCEMHCRRGMVDDPMNLLALTRFAVEHSDLNDYKPSVADTTGKRIAVIGGGPAGLSCAYYLAVMGHKVTIFEQRHHLGGMLRYGIPSYRLPRERLQAEIDWILSAGIDVELDHSVNGEELARLRDEFDAVYLAIGAHSDKKLGLPGEEAPGVESAVKMLRAIGDDELPDMSGQRVCVVEVEGCDQLVAACNNYVLDGMVVHTNSPKAREARRTNVQLLLSQHDSRCTSCVRSGNCNLQTIANDLGIFYLPYEQHLAREGWDFDFPIIRDNDKCIKCMRCIKVCESVQGLGIWDLTNRATHTAVGTRGRAPIGKTDCVACGQCITHCPTGALRERDDTETVFDALANPDKIVLVQIAPAVRSAWGEELGISREEATVERLACALRRVGFEYVFDTDFSADLTIMEEGSELLERLGAAAKGEGDSRGWPMFTSCCPGWVRFVKARYPEFVDSLSTSKSPQQMFGAIAKTYYAKVLGVEPERLFVVSVMPCTAKQAECALPSMVGEDGTPDVDVALTVREMVRMIRASHVSVDTLVEEPLDTPLGFGTGAGVIFGATGGVMEAAVRSAYYLVTGKNPDADFFTDVRGLDGWKEAVAGIDGTKVRVAVAHGLGNAARACHDLNEVIAHAAVANRVEQTGGVA